MSKLPAEPKTGLPVPDGWDLEMWKFVKSLQLSGDLRFLLVSRDANGTSLKFNLQALLKEIEQAVSAPAGSSDYNGYFKVVKVSDNSVKVINGNDPTSPKCGLVQVGSQNIELDAVILAISGTGHAYCRIYHDGTEYKAVLDSASFVPSVAKEVYIDLATYDATANPAQVWDKGAIDINGGYVT